MTRDRSRRRVVFYAAGLALSLGDTWGLTEALGGFVFTWPAGVFLSLMMTLEVRAWAGPHPRRPVQAAAWAALAALVAGLAGYWWVCRSLFLVVGHSYLSGLLPALPLAAWTVGRGRRIDAGVGSLGLGLLAFGVFFWTSAGVYWWRTR